MSQYNLQRYMGHNKKNRSEAGSSGTYKCCEILVHLMLKTEDEDQNRMYFDVYNVFVSVVQVKQVKVKVDRKEEEINVGELMDSKDHK